MKIKSQAPVCYVAAHPFKDTCNLCGDRSPCMLLHCWQLFTGSYMQSPLLWGLAEDASPSSGSWGTAVRDGVYGLLLLLPVPIALACGAWLLRNRSVRWQWRLSLGLQQIKSVNL